MSMMHNPPHPGGLLKDDIEALGLTVTQAASMLAMSRQALSRVLNEHAAVSPGLAVRLEHAGLSTARAWLAMQMNHDLWQAMHTPHPRVRRMMPVRDWAREMAEAQASAAEPAVATA